jgi:hypothetical protein
MDPSHRIRLNQIVLHLELIRTDLEILANDVTSNNSLVSDRLDIETKEICAMVKTLKYLAEGGQIVPLPF